MIAIEHPDRTLQQEAIIYCLWALFLGAILTEAYHSSNYNSGLIIYAVVATKHEAGQQMAVLRDNILFAHHIFAPSDASISIFSASNLVHRSESIDKVNESWTL